MQQLSGFAHELTLLANLQQATAFGCRWIEVDDPQKTAVSVASRPLVTVASDSNAFRLAGTLSHGEQRQLEIAMVIATDPKVVLLDEPLAGMSGSESRDMVELIKTLRHGRAVLLVEHDMDAVFAVADKLTVMADGKVIASGAPEDVRRHPAVRAAYLGVETLHT